MKEILGRGESQTIALCSCTCGKEIKAGINNLTRGITTSCGCWRGERISAAFTTHGKATKGVVCRAYKSWSHMKARCLNPKAKCYPDYGGRGIKVCERWMKFENFFADMGDRPKWHSIERKDVNKDYCPENCEWIPIREQGKNTRRTKLSIETAREIRAMRATGMTYKAIAAHFGITFHSVHAVAVGRQWKEV